MASVLVFCEFGPNGLKKSTLELLSAARRSGLKIQALALGSGAKGLTAALGKESVATGRNPEWRSAGRVHMDHFG